MENKNIHSGHRQRKKDFFLERGIDGLADHEVLEILLFYAIPTGDTNPLAHRLIDRFGSLKAVIDASLDELSQVRGVGQHCASLILLFKHLSRRYFTENLATDGIFMNESEKMKQYCRALFIGEGNQEHIHSLFFDNNLKLLGQKLICSGDIAKVGLPVRQIAEQIFAAKSSRAAIAHNHPNGLAMPSQGDIDATIELKNILGKIGVELVDHVIVGTNGEYSMKEVGYL